MPALRPSSTRRQGLIRLAACAASLFLVFAGMNIGAAVAAPAAPEAPVIHCAWALASVGTSATFEYGPDDDTTTPLFGAGAPCASDPTGVASQPTGAQGMLHVQPNPTAPRELELWAAVSHPTSDAFASGDGAVAWIIHKPNGRELARVEPTGRSCAGTTAPGPMWTAASTTDSGTGAFSMETVTNVAGSGLWQACRQGQIRAFFGRLSLPADAACGSYPVTTSATVDGETSTLDYSIEVLCPLMVNLDTTEIHWNVEPGGTATVKGDLDPATIDNPTITNNGKGPVQIGVVFTRLRSAGLSDSIAEFGVMLQPKIGEVTGISRLSADADGWIPGPAAVVCPGVSVPINLVVHAPASLAPGEYSGSVHVIARAGGRC